MLNRRTLILTAAATIPMAGLSLRPALAAEPAVFSHRGVAIRGTDPVAYFTEGQPVQGSADFSAQYDGATWHFASSENREAFLANPTKYAPQYGGYCAYAVSEGYTASITPSAWRIVDGKLYLNYSRRVQRIWERDIPGRIRSGDANWPSVLNN